MKKKRPDSLILFGPFLDKSHEILKSGVIPYNNDYISFDEFFQEIMCSIEYELLQVIYKYRTESGWKRIGKLETVYKTYKRGRYVDHRKGL